VDAVLAVNIPRNWGENWDKLLLLNDELRELITKPA
jgi:hypothetical protein